MAPREKRQEAGRTAKKGETESAAGQNKREQEQAKQVRVGVSCYYLICVSSRKKKPRKTTSTKKTEGRENEPQKAPDLTSREFFQTLSGANRQQIKQKHREQNQHQKHKTQQPPKNKSSLPKIFQTATLRREERQKKRQKTPNQTQKTQNEKNGQHFPFGGTRTTGKNLTMCDSTVAVRSSPTPFLGRPLRRSAGRG